MFEFNYKKAVQALNFLALNTGGSINKMKAIKLIWLSDRAHLRRYGRPIIMDQYYALPYGPVPSNTKDLAENNAFSSELEVNYRDKFLKIIDSYNFRSVASIDEKVFSQTDITILVNVFKEFGNISEFDLSKLSHNYPEWKKFEDNFKSRMGPSRFMMNYLDFFDDPPIGNNKIFNQSSELLALARENFTDNLSVIYEPC